MSPAEEAYETLIQFLYRAPIGLVQIGAEGAVEMLNPMSSRLLMPLAREGNLDNLFCVLADVAPQLRAMVASYEADSGVVCEFMRVEAPGADGRAPMALSISLLKLDPARLMAVLEDVTLVVEREQQGLARRLSDAARLDNLTGIPNRTAVLELLQQGLARAPGDAGFELTMLFVNCDRFKQINDSLGHAAGDEVLGRMANRLRSCLRQDSGRVDRPPLVARVGGDEFVVVLDDLHGPGDVDAVAQRLIDVLARPYAIGARQVSCPVSMGVVMRAEASGDADALLQDASIAMVEAKRAGGSRHVIFEAAMREQATRRGDIETGLRRALGEGGLFVVYQPVVGLHGDRLVDRSAGVEALVRWRHPTRGIVPPFEFIGIAEECGLIAAIGDFVLTTACTDFVRWQDELGERAPRLLAVNLSRAQVGPGCAAGVRAVLESTAMPAGQLQLEITESLAAQDASVQGRLHALKALGLKLALDDFGTGYSSLASLHLLPVDTVKIDRSFVAQADSSRHHRVLIQATVQVAHSLGMSTVAEGIETEAQADVVRSLGCEKGQGYLYSRPLEEPALRRWLLAWPALRAASPVARPEVATSP